MGAQRSDGQKHNREIKAELVFRIGSGPHAGQSTRKWLKEVEGLTKSAMSVLGKAEVGLIWMQGISVLTMFEQESNSLLNSPESKVLKAAREYEGHKTHFKENASYTLEWLTKAQEFSMLRGILTHRDIQLAVEVGKKLQSEMDTIYEGRPPLENIADTDKMILGTLTHMYKNIRKAAN
jgi:hypothetical protein